jgi:hypothetical protein
MSDPRPAALWQLDGVFCVGLSAFHGELRAAARAQGFSWLAPILLHDPAAEPNQQELAAHAETFRAEGWSLCGWGTFAQADTPENDARAAADLVTALGLDGWIANGEAWAEGALRDRSSRFVAAWRQTGCAKPLALSCLSSDTANFPRDFDYAAWVGIGAAVMPQVYGNEHPGLTVGACLGNLKTGGIVPRELLSLTFGTYGTFPRPYDDYATWHGPRTVYLGENTPVEDWPKLHRQEEPMPPTPPQPVKPKTKTKTKPAPVALTELQFPFTGPCHGASSGQEPTQSPTVVALKRAVSRLGLLEWTEFDQVYDELLEGGLGEWQDSVGIHPASGQYGKGTWEKLRAAVVPAGKAHAGELALDTVAQTLVQDEAEQTSTSEEEALVQKFITEFWTIAIANKDRWHYSQDRPAPLDDDPAAGGKSDCSAMVFQAHHYARTKTGFDVPDPAQQNWTGRGSTDLGEDDWPKVGAPYRVGDLAHFKNERHVIECIKAGDVDTAQWASNGREEAPELISSLRSYSRYPDEFLFVVRPTLVK